MRGIDGSQPQGWNSVTSGSLSYIKGIASGAITANALVIRNGVDTRGRPKFIAASSAADATTNGEMYVAEHAAIDGGNVALRAWKQFTNVDTSTSAVGSPVYLSTAGGYSFTAGTVNRIVGSVLSVSASVGVIILAPQAQSGDTSSDPSGELRSVVVTIPTASVKTLNATPYELVPAGGATVYNVLERAHLFMDYGTAAYDGVAAGDTFQIKYTDGSGAAVTAALNPVGFANQTNDESRLVIASDNVIPVANAALVAHVNAGEWYSAAGDSPLIVQAWYRQILVSPAS
jgi:hypothetical protein